MGPQYKETRGDATADINQRIVSEGGSVLSETRRLGLNFA
jgi:hypothetical protein